jgi:enoyl-CoA hydratase/carnithine racemase
LEAPTSAHPDSPQSVSVHLDEALVGTVEFHNPPDNYFDVDLIGRICGACEELAADGECRAIVLRSRGRHFCAGANFARRDTLSGSGDNRPHLYEMALRLFDQPLPMVAEVQGAAVGGGLGLALAADFRVATPLAHFSANFSVLGFHQGFGLSITLPAAVGRQAALELLYTGRRVKGAEAYRLGLCDRLVEPEALHREAHALAAEIAAAAPLALRSIRETLRHDLVAQVRAVLPRERAEQERLMRSADWREGIAAARDRRTPRFAGR